MKALDWLFRSTRILGLSCSAEGHTRFSAHGELVTGLGMMGDAICCLRCGRERYEEHWSKRERSRATTYEAAVHGSDLRRARNLPNGINSSSGKTDAAFEAWLRSPIYRDDGERIPNPWNDEIEELVEA